MFVNPKTIRMSGRTSAALHPGTITSRYELQRNPACQTGRSSCCLTLHNLPLPGSGDANRGPQRSQRVRGTLHVCVTAGGIAGQALWLTNRLSRSCVPYQTHSLNLPRYRYCVFSTLGAGSRRGRNVSSSLSSEMYWLHCRDSDRQTWLVAVPVPPQKCPWRSNGRQ
jgi:hypothetical protein